MRRALLVGIDGYGAAPLAGCVHDARRLEPLLARHHDGSPNFECMVLASDNTDVDRATLYESVDALLAQPAESVLFFFAGHGTYNDLGGHLLTQDASGYAGGMSMSDLVTMVSKSPADEVTVFLDCCHSGAFGSIPAVDAAANSASLRSGVSILTASRATESASESQTGGVFTSLVCDALTGAAADVCGRVTTASIYAYVDQALGAWDQRPLFKAHVSKLSPLRRAAPAVPLEVLRLLPQYFATASRELALDPSYEPTAEPRDPPHETAFRHLQRYRDAALVRPIGADHLYDAAMESQACGLTGLGRYYWDLANRGKL